MRQRHGRNGGRLVANPKHIAWLREGVEAWNARRKDADFRPDLEDADIPDLFGTGPGIVHSGRSDVIDLSSINLSRAKLRLAILNNVNLSNADLRDADLRECELNGAILDDAHLDFADLRGADCTAAELKRAKLFRAKLNTEDSSDGPAIRGTNLVGAHLQEAVLAEAALCGADLSLTNLVGTNLSQTCLWKATLFSGNQLSRSEGVHSNNDVCSVTLLLDGCRRVRERRPNGDEFFYFRGEGSDDWELRPSAMRHEKLRYAEGTMLVDLMCRRPQDFDSLQSMIGQWVLAQHHGLKTRLLDITKNPLVALFHACEDTGKSGRLHVFTVPKDLVKPFNSDTISIITNFAKLPYRDQQLLLTKENEYGDALSAMRFPQVMDRLYHFIREEKPYFQKEVDPRDLFRVFIVEPQQAFERIRAQSGAFLISAFHDRFEPEEVLKWNRGIPIYTHDMFKVPRDSKQCIMEELAQLNITQETLFPGIDEAAMAVTERYLQ